MSPASHRFGRVEVRPRERRLFVDGREVTVGARAFDLLLVLIEQRDRLVTKQELLDWVWPNMVVEEANLSVQVAALRKALGARAIATIPGRGYQFALADDEAADAPPALPAAPARPEGSVASAASAGAASPPPPSMPPGESEPLVGREEEVYEIVGQLAEHRLFVIVGDGGIGKTRLARAVLRRLREDFVDGVWWVDLTSATRADDVLRSIARSVGAPVAEEDAAPSLAQALAPRSRMLIVLDNCEQVAAGVGAAAMQLLNELPWLRLLATSRVPLHVPAEQVWRIESLAVPPAGATLADARRCSAFELLELRVRAADRHFAFDAAGLPLGIEICRRLEGHPLAIEMAAARVPQIGLAALLERFDERLRLLRSSDRSLPERQSDLRSLLDWSVSLLDAVQRAVLRRLAVFVGSFGLAAAQATAAGEDADPWDVLEGLAGLVDHSLVQVVSASDTASTGPTTVPALLRYRLTATTRLYALERLIAAGEAASARAGHRRAMVAIADSILALRWTPEEWRALDRHGAEQEDLRLAFDAARDAGDAAAAARLGAALMLLDRQRGIPGTSRRLGAAARALLGHGPDPQSQALLWDLVAAELRGAEGLAADARCVEAWSACGHRRALIEALCDQARRLAGLGRADDARTAMARAAEALRSDDAAAWHAEAAIAAADVAVYDVPSATSARLALEASLLHYQPANDAPRLVRALLRRAELALVGEQADPGAALAWTDRALAMGPQSPAFTLGRAWRLRCVAYLDLGDFDRARSAAGETLPLLRARLQSEALFDALAVLAAHEGRRDLASLLLACADRWYNDHRVRSDMEVRLRAMAAQAIAEPRARAGRSGAAKPDPVAATFVPACLDASIRELLRLPEDD